MAQVTQLRAKFVHCKLVLIRKSKTKFSFKFAEEALVSQIKRLEESSAAINNAYETCLICYEERDAYLIFSVHDCIHRYCYSCTKRCVEANLLLTEVPKCPDGDCDSKLNVDSISKLLTPKLAEILKQRVKEASIPVAERIYCPNKKCSALMSKSEVLEYSQRLPAKKEISAGARLCIACNSSFCINCRVPWHPNMSCSQFPGPSSEESKLKSLAAIYLWRQCTNCNHMIELSSGCCHMTCR